MYADWSSLTVELQSLGSATQSVLSKLPQNDGKQVIISGHIFLVIYFWSYIFYVIYLLSYISCHTFLVTYFWSYIIFGFARISKIFLI